MSRRALVVVRAGDASRHPGWLAGEREFDVLVSYYGASPGRFRDGADLYHEMRGSCWTGNAAVCRAFDLSSYEHVAFSDDDVVAEAGSWNRLFEICRDYSLDLASPAFTGYIADDLRPAPGTLLRYTDVLELICPVFSRRALRVVSPHFGENGSGWGQSSLWAMLCPRESFRTAVVDAVPVEHSRPFGGGDIYANLGRSGTTAEAEMQALFKKWGIRRWRRTFYGSVPLL